MSEEQLHKAAEGGGERSPGQRLRAERERRGLSLEQVAAELHMDINVARALEADDYTPLGAPIFVKGHLRNYAKLLGLDAGALITQYERLAAPQTPELVARPEPVGAMRPGASDGGWLIGVAGVLLLLLAGLLGWWFYQDKDEAARVDEPVPAAGRLAAGPAETAGSAGAREPGAEPDAAQNAPADSAPSATGGAGQTGPESETAAQLRPQAETQAGAPRAASAPDAESGFAEPPPPAPLRLRLRFIEESWVEVYDAGGEPLLYELGRAGQTRSLRAEPPVRVFLGNASGVELSVNGRAFELAPRTRNDRTARFTLDADG